MGLLDQIIGQLGGGAASAAPTPQAQQGMSPVTKAVLAFLAYKAYQAYQNRQQAAPGTQTSASGGGLGGLLGGLAGGNLGNILAGVGGAGGLGQLVEQFQRNGFGQHMQSWVGTGPNASISPDEIEKALGSDTIDEISRQFGMQRGQVSQELAHELPQAVDQATPTGQLPQQRHPEAGPQQGRLGSALRRLSGRICGERHLAVSWRGMKDGVERKRFSQLTCVVHDLEGPTIIGFPSLSHVAHDLARRLHGVRDSYRQGREFCALEILDKAGVRSLVKVETRHFFSFHRPFVV